MLLMMAAQWYVSSSYNRWSRVQARSQMTGAQAAQRLMQSAGLYDVCIEGVPGNMTDHYDPRSKTLRLSQGTANSPSVAALAIAAHELGHALQDKEGSLPLKLRGAIVPAVNIGSYLGWIFDHRRPVSQCHQSGGRGLDLLLRWCGVCARHVARQLNASARARELLSNAGIIRGEDKQRGVNTVLNAAALTYVAALVTAVLQLLYFANLVFDGEDSLNKKRRSRFVTVFFLLG